MKSELQRIKIALLTGKWAVRSFCRSNFLVPVGASDFFNEALSWADEVEGAPVEDLWPTFDHYKHLRAPDFLNDLNDAVTLCDVLAEEGWSCWTDNAIPRAWQCTFRSVRNRQAEEIEHTAPTLAEAICGAFLKAKGLWTEDAATV